jgi:hypothetical protein
MIKHEDYKNYQFGNPYMEKLNRLFMSSLMVGLLSFSTGLVIQAQMAQALNASSTLVTEIRSGNSTDIPPDEAASAEASCLPDETITSGGWFTGSQHGSFITESRPIGNGWKVSALNPTSEGDSLNVYAVCGHLEPIP